MATDVSGGEQPVVIRRGFRIVARLLMAVLIISTGYAYAQFRQDFSGSVCCVANKATPRNCHHDRGLIATSPGATCSTGASAVRRTAPAGAQIIHGDSATS